MNVFQRRESNVRSYCRTFPTVFNKALGSHLFSEDGTRYIDFFSGAGGLNYGHNHPQLIEAVINYFQEQGVLHSLDMSTRAKQEFLERFEKVILQPRQMDYKIQFPGPTGTNAVEAALKLARKATGRRNVISFTNGYHGLTGNSLATTANSYYRNEFYRNSSDVCFMPFDGYHGSKINTADLLSRYLEDPSSGLDLPAAIILETVQAEGGINVASSDWLRQIEALCCQYEITLIVDDIQAGCGRTGTFFSFEEAGIQPDMVTLSKSISGVGLPMSLLLIKEHLDCWEPGEHTGTFRGNNPAFVAATGALNFWEDSAFVNGIHKRSQRLDAWIAEHQNTFADQRLTARGKGLIRGLECADPNWAGTVSRKAFEKGVLVETCGGKDQVLKLLPALNIDMDALETGLNILLACMHESIEDVHHHVSQPTA